MRRTNIISAIWKSFYSQDLYQDVRMNWGFGIVLYVLILAVLYTLVSISTQQTTLTKFMMCLSESVTQKIPTGKVANGKMTINAPSPYTVYYQEKGQEPKPFLVFDMTDKIQPSQTIATIIFHSNGYYSQDNTTQNNPQTIKLVQQETSYTFRTYPNTSRAFTFSAEQAQKLVDKLIVFIPMVFFIVIGLLKFLFKLLQGAVYAFIVMIFGGFFKIHFGYGQAFRLAIMAATPAFIVVGITQLFVAIPHPWSIAFIIELIYLYFAAYANRQQQEQI